MRKSSTPYEPPRAAAPIPRREREKSRRREDILRAAERVFSRSGFAAATMQDIAREAEFSVGTLYTFFPSKDELSTAFIQEHLEGAVRSIREAAAGTHPAPKKIRDIVAALMAFFQSHRDMFQRYVYEVPSPQTVMKENVVVPYVEVLSILEQVIREGMAAGHLRRVKPFDAGIALLGLVVEYVFIWIHIDQDMDLSTRVDTIVDLYLKGVHA